MVLVRLVMLQAYRILFGLWVNSRDGPCAPGHASSLSHPFRVVGRQGNKASPVAVSLSAAKLRSDFPGPGLSQRLVFPDAG